MKWASVQFGVLTICVRIAAITFYVFFIIHKIFAKHLSLFAVIKEVHCYHAANLSGVLGINLHIFSTILSMNHIPVKCDFRTAHTPMRK